MQKLKSSLLSAAALAILIGSLAVPAHAQSAAPKDGMVNVETRISTLHDKLMITADEDEDWQAVAQTMRENEAEMSQLIQARHQSPQSMSAVEDLQSYQKIAQAHADGLKKMAASFETLYDDMSDDQKKNADQVFAHFEGHADMKKHGKHK